MTFFPPNQSLEAETKRADFTDAHVPTEETFVPGHPHKSDHTARPKIQSYSQTRRPAGGMSRPLPSPGKIKIYDIICQKNMTVYSHNVLISIEIVFFFYVFTIGLTQLKPHHILTISDLEETRRPRRYPPHSQTAGSRSHIPPPPLSPLSGQMSVRAGKSPLPSSPLFGATDNLINSPLSRAVGGRSASSVRCPGNTMTHCTSSFFPQSAWQDNMGSLPSPNLNFSSSIHLPRSRLSFDLSQSDSVEVPHNFLASPEPEDVSPANGTSPQGNLDQPKGEEEFSYSSFHKEPRAELEIEETLLSESVAMNCEGQIVVEGDHQEEFWGRTQNKNKTLVASLPRSAAKDDLANSSSDDDMEHYFDFSRTIVTCPGSKDQSKSPSSPSSRPMTQLDGVDDGTESDASMVTSDDAQKVKGSDQSRIQVKGLKTKSAAKSDAASERPPVRSVSPEASSKDKHTDSCSSREFIPPFVSPRSSTNSSWKEQSSDPPLKNQESVLPTPVQNSLPTLLTNVPETSCAEAVLQGPSLEFTSGASFLLQKCGSGSHLTKAAPLPEGGSGLGAQQSDASKPPNSSPPEGPAMLMNPGNATESNNNNQGTLLDLLQPTPLMSAEQNPPQGLVDSLQMYSCLPGLSQSALTGITLQPVTLSSDSTNVPCVELLSTKLTTLSTVGDVTQPLLNVAPQSEPAASAAAGTYPPVAETCATVTVPVHSTQTQHLGSSGVTIVTSSPSGLSLSGLSASCSAAPAPAQASSAPVILNGYSSSAVQKEATCGHMISINFSAPRPALEPQQPVVPQAFPGHAILTVKEVGGPNVDPTPHVLLVNRLGQIFVKNPETNTFHLPTPNSPSYNCVTQIASLLQSNALSATLAAAGNMTATPPVTNVTKAVAPSVTPTAENTAAIAQLLTQNSNGAVELINVKKPRKHSKAAKDESGQELKKSKKKKEPGGSKKSKSSKGSNQPAALTKNPSMTPAESAQAIINQAMAGNYTPKRSGLQTLSPSSLVLPPGLLVEAEPTALPRSPSPAPPAPLPAPRPRTHVRMKRVSSLSDRIVSKKSKVDFLKAELIVEEEECCRPAFPSISSGRASGVRIKTPTVKGVLNLDDFKEEHFSDSDSSG